ncbi:hypothetical protein [Saccharomonospora viridis]|uniref:hypothetical protein n=1 Tax=Saccharomonospora viridis TaxID=1852 RepID=UPI0024096131|nr:hypothetical protein [Saccharomonospora viridis]
MTTASTQVDSPRTEAITRRQPLLAALVVAALGAVMSVVGAVAPALDGASRGFPSAPLLAVLAVVPVAVAFLLLLRSRFGMAAGVLMGAATLAPAAVVLDLQLLVDPSAASRPELYFPRDLSLPSPSIGLWALLAGHGFALVAGVVALAMSRQEPGSAFDDTGARGIEGDSGGSDDSAAWRRRSVLLAFLIAVVGACGLLMAPFHSSDLYLLARNAFEGPAVELVGRVLSAATLSAGAVLLVVVPREVTVAGGGLLGLALALAAWGVPPLAAALSMTSLDIAVGPCLVVAAVLGLLFVATRHATDVTVSSTSPKGTRLPGGRKLELATGVFASVTGASAVLGAVLPQLTAIGSADAPESPARWLLLAAGGVIGLLGLAMFVTRVATAVRPVLSVAWVGVPLAATAVLDTALTTGYTSTTFSPTQYGSPVDGLDPLGFGPFSSGPGAVWAWLAMVGAVVTACCSVVAGVVEREDAEDAAADEVSGEDGNGIPDGVTTVGLRMLIPLTAAAVLAIAAFGTPLVTAPEYVEPGLWSDVGTPTWGLAAAVLVIVGACVLATRSRPARAAALLAGVACVVGLRAATAPLVGGEIDGSAAGLGLWFSLAALAALAGAGAVAMTGRRA